MSAIVARWAATHSRIHTDLILKASLLPLTHSYTHTECTQVNKTTGKQRKQGGNEGRIIQTHVLCILFLLDAIQSNRLEWRGPWIYWYNLFFKIMMSCQDRNNSVRLKSRKIRTGKYKIKPIITQTKELLLYFFCHGGLGHPLPPAALTVEQCHENKVAVKVKLPDTGADIFPSTIQGFWGAQAEEQSTQSSGE